MQPLVSAVVLNYQSPKDTVKCVHALLSQTIADKLEILVVDNHSNDESIGFIRAQLGSIPSVRIIEERTNVGYGRGNNAALRFVQGEYLLIVNPDNTLPHDAIEKMLQALQAHPDAGIVGPALIHPDGSVRPSARKFPRIIDLLRKRLWPERWQADYNKTMAEMQLQESVDVDWLVGACLLMKTELFRTLGGYDKRYFLFFEDIDICRRAHALGKKVLYLPHVRALDRKTRLSGSTAFSLLTKKTTRIHLQSALQYFWKWNVAGYASK